MQFPEKLKSLRRDYGITQVDLAEKLGISKSTLAMYETNKREPNYETLMRIGQFFCVSVDYLLGTEHLRPENMSPKGVKIPVLGRVQAGIPIEAVEEILDYEEIPAKLAATGEFFALKIRGNSMEPRIYENDVVIVRKQEALANGEVGIVMINGDEATCKKVSIHQEGISLISLNPAFDPMFFTKREVQELPLRILGKVVELRGKM